MKERTGNHKAQKGRVQFGVLQKLLIGILVPLFAVLIVMGVFLGLQGASTVDDVMGSDLDAETRAAANQVESFFNKYYGIAECLSATQIVRDTTTEVTEGGIAAHRLYGSLLETLRLIQQNYEEDIDFIWVANLKTGQILQNDGTIYEKSQVDYTTRSWYSLVMDAQDTITTEAYVSANNDSLMLTVASPVFVDGSIEGIIGIDLNMDHLNQILSTIKVGDTGYITLYDLQNEIVYHPDSSVMGTNAADANYSSNMLNAILNKQNISSTLYTRGGTEYYGSTTAIDAVGYTVLGVMPVAEYTAHINATVRILIIGVLGCGILLALICVLIALSITRPLKHLNTAVGKLPVHFPVGKVEKPPHRVFLHVLICKVDRRRLGIAGVPIIVVPAEHIRLSYAHIFYQLIPVPKSGPLVRVEDDTRIMLARPLKPLAKGLGLTCAVSAFIPKTEADGICQVRFHGVRDKVRRFSH